MNLRQARKRRALATVITSAIMMSAVVIIGSEKSAMDFGKFLFNNGVFAQPIRYPTVPKNQARLRISMTAWLSKNDIEFALSVFDKAAKKFKII